MSLGRLLVVGALFAGCKAASAPECVDDGDCDGIAVCNAAQVCEAVQCVESIQCPLGTFCQFNTCFTGCAEPSDCFPGEVCDVARNQCTEAACVDAELDCRLGEECNDGVCAVTPGLCEPCTGSWGGGCSTDPTAACVYVNDAYVCLPACTPGGDVPGPRGFTCVEYGSGHVWYGRCEDVARDAR
jgi:hypothetical protein